MCYNLSMSISAAAFSTNIDLSSVYNVRQANYGVAKFSDTESVKVADPRSDELNDEAIISSGAMSMLKTQATNPQNEEQDNSRANSNANSEDLDFGQKKNEH